LQNESEFTQNDVVQSTTSYYVHEPKYEHVKTRVQRLSGTNMEAKVFCFVNFNQELTIEANPTQEPETKVNCAQKQAAKTIKV